MIKPLNDYIVLKYKKKEIKTDQGIYLGLNDKNDNDNIGVVVSCGPKVKEIEINSEVIFQDHSFTKVKIKNEEYLIVKNDDIIALLV
ncbi:MAG: co-chaperone GroES [Candidatus Phytoplasma stylosanthis]|nr:co-chaperone GroES [Candidatus Phytoplasma stylosanthis]